MLYQRKRTVALILFIALAFCSAGGQEQGALSLSLSATLPDYADLGLSLAQGGRRARFEWSGDTWGASLALPWLRLGSLEPVALAAFIQRPQGLSYRLGRYEPQPFSAPAPLDASLRGAVAGSEGGCFIMDPLSDGLPSWSGAWLSPRTSPLSALTAWAALPADTGDGSWNDPPVPALSRSWQALGGYLSLGPWKSALGMGAMQSSPGEDAWALRLENLLSLRHFKLESVSSLCLGSWRGPSDSLAPAFFIDAALSARIRRLSLYLDYDEKRGDWQDLPQRGIQFGGKADAGFSLLEASVEASFLGSAAAHMLELRWKASPFILPWLSAYGSYELKGPQPERLELGCSLKAGHRHSITLEGLWRVDTEGRYLKLNAGYALSLPRGRLLFFLKTDGWLCYEPPASASESPIVAGLRYSQSFP